MPTTTDTSNATAAPSQAPATAPKKSYYRPQLDGLRFVAFLAVYFQHTFHAGPDYYLHWAVLRPLHITPAISDMLSRITLTGGMGVSLFFALSSYLITELLLREIENTGSIHLKFFYARRVLRIWPVYGVVLFLGIVVLPLLHLSQPIPPIYVAGYLLFAGNWTSAILGGAAVLAPISPLWSISIEEQFYLFWPVTIQKLGLRHLKTVCFALIAIGELSRLLFTHFHAGNDLSYYNTFTHFDAIAWGALFALSRKDEGTPTVMPLWQRTAIAAAVAALLVAALLYHDPGGYVVSLVLLPLLSFCCPVIIFLALQSNFLGRKPLPYLGKISYGLYAYHAMVIFLLDKVVPQGSWVKLLMIPAKFLVATAVAALSYKFIEAPILKFKERFTFVHSRPI